MTEIRSKRPVLPLFLLSTFLEYPDSYILLIIKNSTSLTEGNHERDGVWKSNVNEQRFLRYYFFVFSFSKIHQLVKNVPDT